jgi:DNA-binding XRE family transcriptional regulator
MKNTDNNKIGSLLKSLRGSRTIKDVAKSIGISESALAMYETGKRVPRDEIKMKISKYYKKSVGSIFFEESAH